MITNVLLNLEDILRKVGRGVIFYHADSGGNAARWDGDGPINLQHLGDTEGEISLAANASIETLTLPEISGTSVHEAEYTGEDPQLSIPIFLADPTLLPVISPAGSAHAGYFRTRAATERTLVVFPERLHRKADNTYANITYTAGTGWRLDGAALTTAQVALLGMSVWLWRTYFDRPPRRFLGGHGDAGKNIETVTARAMMHPLMPDGHRLYTSGDPSLANINIDASAS